MMETLKKYWYVAVGLVLVLFMYMRKKTTPRRRRMRRNTMRRSPMRYSRMSYSRPMRRRTRR